MKPFERKFEVEKLIEWNEQVGDNAVEALFQHWVLPGEAAGRYGLRVGIRDGYLNLYVKGQAVAKLRLSRNKPQLELHRKYYLGYRKGDPRGAESGNQYVTLSSDQLTREHAVKSVPFWIETAATYSGAEKRFVDDLISANPGVIDLEMGLPAGDPAPGRKKTAPRMDLILVQPSANGRAEIAFWEAKCSTNGELRAETEYAENDTGERIAGPRVVHQLRTYQQWMRAGGRETEIRQGYRNTAQILLALADYFGAPGAKARNQWRFLAEAQNVQPISPPGIVIGNYCPEGHNPQNETERAAFEARAGSFTEHRSKLERHGITVKQFWTAPMAEALPQLRAGAVTA